MKGTQKTPLAEKPAKKTLGQHFYESTGPRLTRWESLTLASRKAYDDMATRYEAARVE